MKTVSYSLLFICVLASLSSLRAQTLSGSDSAKDPRVYLRPYFDRLGIEADEEEDNCNEKNFLRWLHRWYYRMDEHAVPYNYDRPSIRNAHSPQAARNNTRSFTPPWHAMGPNYSEPGSGIGRVMCVAFNPGYSNILYAGAPDGGFWISTDTGAHWVTTNDQWASTGIDDIAVNPVHPDTIYAATGDRDFWDAISVGVIKSTDGGYTWDTTGLTFPNSGGQEMIKIQIDPVNTSTLYAATKDGTNGKVYKSTDAGNTWTIVATISGEISDLKMLPGNSNVLFVCNRTGTLWRTTDAGATWTDITANLLPLSGDLMTFGVTQAAPNNIYIMAQGGPSPTFMTCGVWKSCDTGNTFTKMGDNSLPTVVDWFGYTFAISDLDSNLMLVGGGTAYQSNDGGNTYSSIMNSPTGSFVHVDIHDLKFRGTEGYICSDGGLWRCTNLSGPYRNWQDVSGDMNISELYDFMSAANSPTLFILGMQDNGSGYVQSDRLFRYGAGGDGMGCAINPLDSNNCYESYQSGNFFKSYDKGLTFTPFANTTILGEGGDWTTPIQLSQTDTNTIWTGFQNIWKTSDQGTTWRKLGNIPNPGGFPILCFYVYPADTNIIYMQFDWGYPAYKTMDDGATWSLIGTTGMSSQIYHFSVDSTNPYHIFAICNNNYDGEKVYETFDTGATWTNISYNLPNVGMEAIIYENNGQHRLFAGTDMGIYYRKPADTSWSLYGSGMPNTNVNKLEIHALTHTLRAGTYGRGVWQCTLDTSNATLGIANASGNEDQFFIYPNPAKNNLTVSATGNITSIVISNMLGQELIVRNCNSNLVNIDISALPQGVYLVQVNNGAVKKMVKANL